MPYLNTKIDYYIPYVNNVNKKNKKVDFFKK